MLCAVMAMLVRAERIDAQLSQSRLDDPRTVRAYVVDADECSLRGRVNDETSVDSRGQRSRYFPVKEVGSQCDYGTNSLALGSSINSIQVEEAADDEAAKSFGDMFVSQMSIEIWFSNDLATSSQEATFPILTIADRSSEELLMEILVDNKLWIVEKLFGYKLARFPLGVPAKENCHMVLNIDHSSVSVYVNSILRHFYPMNLTVPPSQAAARAYFRLGGRADGVPDAWWKGSFQVITLYSEKLRVEDVQELYLAGTKTSSDSILESFETNTTIDLQEKPFVAMFNTVAQLKLNQTRLDVLCDENKRTCGLSYHSKFVVRNLPSHGMLIDCLNDLKLDVGETYEIDRFCYSASAAPFNVQKPMFNFLDSVVLSILDESSTQFRFLIDVHKGILVCNTSLSLVEDSLATTTLRAISTIESIGSNYPPVYFVISDIEYGSLFFKNGTKIPSGQTVEGYSCSCTPNCFEHILHTIYCKCLDIVFIPAPNYFNEYDYYFGPEHPPWSLEPAQLTYHVTNDWQQSTPATLNIYVQGETDVTRLSVNQTTFNAPYLQRSHIGTFDVWSSDLDADQLVVVISSTHSNLFAISNSSAMALCENPFLVGDGTGNSQIRFKAVPSVILAILNSLTYINIGRGVTQDEVQITVEDTVVIIVALLG